MLMKKDSKTLDKDYIISLRVPLSLHSKFDEWKDSRSLPHGKEGRAEINKIILDMVFKETALFDKELVEKLDKVFIEGTLKEKLHLAMDRFFESDTKYPYLTTKEKKTPEKAGFPPCPYVKALYWKEEFLGFQCRAIKPPAFKLATIKVGRLSFQVTTPEDCWDCQKLCKQNRVGIDVFGHITLEQIVLHQDQLLLQKAKSKHEVIAEKSSNQVILRKTTESQYEKLINKKLDDKGLRIKYKKAVEIFSNMERNPETREWKGITRASRAMGTSRPTIYALIKAFPEGLR